MVFVLVQQPLYQKKTLDWISLYKTCMNKDITELAKQEYDAIYFPKLN